MLLFRYGKTILHPGRLAIPFLLTALFFVLREAQAAGGPAMNWDDYRCLQAKRLPVKYTSAGKGREWFIRKMCSFPKDGRVWSWDDGTVIGQYPLEQRCWLWTETGEWYLVRATNGLKGYAECEVR